MGRSLTTIPMGNQPTVSSACFDTFRAMQTHSRGLPNTHAHNSPVTIMWRAGAGVCPCLGIWQGLLPLPVGLLKVRMRLCVRTVLLLTACECECVTVTPLGELNLFLLCAPYAVWWMDCFRKVLFSSLSHFSSHQSPSELLTSLFHSTERWTDLSSLWILKSRDPDSYRNTIFDLRWTFLLQKNALFSKKQYLTS